MDFNIFQWTLDLIFQGINYETGNTKKSYTFRKHSKASREVQISIIKYSRRSEAKPYTNTYKIQKKTKKKSYLIITHLLGKLWRFDNSLTCKKSKILTIKIQFSKIHQEKNNHTNNTFARHWSFSMSISRNKLHLLLPFEQIPLLRHCVKHLQVTNPKNSYSNVTFKSAKRIERTKQWSVVKIEKQGKKWTTTLPICREKRQKGMVRFRRKGEN